MDANSAINRTTMALHNLIKSKLLLLGFLLTTWLCCSGFDHVPQGADAVLLQEAREGQTLIMERRYKAAQDHFLKLSRRYPQSPLGSFGLMALYNAIMFENYDFSLETSFEQEANTNERILENLLKSDQTSSWDYFLCGASSGLRGFYLVRKDQALKALSQASLSKNCLEKALRKDPNFIDVNFGLGMYQYWRSVFTNQFKVLPFFKDQRAEGIEKIKTVAEKGVVANELAQSALMFIYLQEGKSREGLRLTQELLKKYPDNMIAKMHEGRFLLMQGKYPEALQIFQEIHDRYPKITVALYFEATTLHRMKKNQEAQKLLQEYLTTHPTPPWQAYTYYLLGHLALTEEKRKEAFQYFRAGHRIYGNYKPNLQMLLKLREEDKKN